MVLNETTKRKKICLFSIGAVLLCGVVALCVYGIFFGGLTQEEKEYKKDPSEQNLIELCNSLMFTEQYDKKIEYMPEALKLDEENYEKIYEKTTPAKGQDGNEMKSYSAYREMIMEYMFAYIHTKRYDELQEIFPEMFTLTITKSMHIEFGQRLKAENLTDSDYKLFLKMLEECELGYIEPGKDTFYQLSEKQLNMSTRSLIYLLLGDRESSDIWSQKASEYNKWYLSVIKDKIAKGEITK